MTQRRDQGDGSVYFNQARKRWIGIVELERNSQGRRDRRYVSAKTKPEVREKIKEIQRAVEAGLPVPETRAPTVREWLTHWVEDIAPLRVRPSTLATYRGYINNRIAPALGVHRLNKLAPEHIEAFYTSLLKAGLSPATIRQCHRILNRALKVAVQRARIARNVVGLVEPPSVYRKEVTPLNEEQARAVLQAAIGSRNAARISVALALGLRQGEALGMRWNDIDFDAGQLTVRWALQRQKGEGLVFVPPKSRAGNRVIAVPPQLLTALREHRIAQLSERLAAGPLWQDHDLVFATPLGKPIEPKTDYMTWRALLTEAKVPHFRLHDARHTAATLLMSQGVPARVVMEILGHSQISLTLGTYSHPQHQMLEDAANKIGRVLFES